MSGPSKKNQNQSARDTLTEAAEMIAKLEATLSSEVCRADDLEDVFFERYKAWKKDLSDVSRRNQELSDALQVARDGLLELEKKYRESESAWGLEAEARVRKENASLIAAYNKRLSEEIKKANERTVGEVLKVKERAAEECRKNNELAAREIKLAKERAAEECRKANERALAEAALRRSEQEQTELEETKRKLEADAAIRILQTEKQAIAQHCEQIKSELSQNKARFEKMLGDAEARLKAMEASCQSQREENARLRHLNESLLSALQEEQAKQNEIELGARMDALKQELEQAREEAHTAGQRAEGLAFDLDGTERKYLSQIATIESRLNALIDERARTSPFDVMPLTIETPSAELAEAAANLSSLHDTIARERGATEEKREKLLRETKGPSPATEDPDPRAEHPSLSHPQATDRT